MTDREMTLQEWCETLPGIHRVNRELAQLRAKLHEVREIYTGSEGFKPATTPEAYCLRVMEQMYEAALNEGEK